MTSVWVRVYIYGQMATVMKVILYMVNFTAKEHFIIKMGQRGQAHGVMMNMFQNRVIVS